MRYTKPPLSFADQVALLQSRGMVIPDHDRTVRYLAHINYYRLRAYWLPFEATIGESGHRFKPGTSFDDALKLYLFDRKFRLLVLEAIERIEVSFRTRFAYALAMQHGSHAYLDVDLFRDPDFHRKLIESLRDEINRSHETFIEHYQTTYDDPALPPIWAVCEVMSFGQLSKWFNSLKHHRDRRDISNAYGIDEVVLNSFMHHLTHVRNLTAHHCRLWNRRLVFTMTIPRRPPSLLLLFNTEIGAERRIYNTLAMLGYLLRIISPGTTWPQRMRQLIDEYDSVDTKDMGFPERWQYLDLWEILE